MKGVSYVAAVFPRLSMGTCICRRQAGRQDWEPLYPRPREGEDEIWLGAGRWE